MSRVIGKRNSQGAPQWNARWTIQQQWGSGHGWQQRTDTLTADALAGVGVHGCPPAPGRDLLQGRGQVDVQDVALQGLALVVQDDRPELGGGHEGHVSHLGWQGRGHTGMEHMRG